MQKLKISVIGLGYVGLPIAVAFAKAGHSVVGYDNNSERIDQLNDGYDHNLEVNLEEELESISGLIEFTKNTLRMQSSDMIIICVSTPEVDHKPDLSNIKEATRTASWLLEEDTILVYESTLYPGCIEDELIPLIVRNSSFERSELKIGYSPERVSPGTHPTSTKLEGNIKLVSATDVDTSDKISKIYSEIVPLGVWQCSIKEAEMAKLVENAQRDVNIAFMNQIALACNSLDINTSNVLRAASTKIGFLNFTPGLVGGHCIPVDPWYLIHSVNETKVNMDLIRTARKVNDGMVQELSKQAIKMLIAYDKITAAEVLILGASYKGETSDTRNSLSVELASELHSYGINVTITDPYLTDTDLEFFQEEADAMQKQYSMVIVAVDHIAYLHQTKEQLESHCFGPPIVMDLIGNRGDWNL